MTSTKKVFLNLYGSLLKYTIPSHSTQQYLHFGVNGVVSARNCVLAGLPSKTTLTNQNIIGEDLVSAKLFDPEPSACGILRLLGGAGLHFRGESELRDEIERFEIVCSNRFNHKLNII